MKYIVVCAKKSKFIPEFYCTMGYGTDDPKRDYLLRDGPCALFNTKEEARAARDKTLEVNKLNPWVKKFELGIIACEEVE